MAYQLKKISIHTDNSKEGMDKINEVWSDIVSGKIPLMYNSDGQFLQGLSPISLYTNYESDEQGAYDIEIFTARADFFTEMELKVEQNLYVKYDFDGKDISEAANRAWSKVWENKAAGKIARAFSKDYESTVPGEYTPDGKAHCYLYISIA